MLLDREAMEIARELEKIDQRIADQAVAVREWDLPPWPGYTHQYRPKCDVAPQRRRWLRT